MLNSWYIHTIKIIRRTKSSVNDFGENVYTYSTAYNNQKARVETYQAKQQYNEAGEREHESIIVYVPNIVTAQLQDEVEYPVGTKLGLVVGIDPALKGQTNTLDHYELIIESP